MRACNVLECITANQVLLEMTFVVLHLRHAALNTQLPLHQPPLLAPQTSDEVSCGVQARLQLPEHAEVRAVLPGGRVGNTGVGAESSGRR